ncbi:MAG: UpxY family transcription antiterminator [Bacteroidales bacterium]|nr:UpxY family transcription antiterminator [Bacteroidales bacterium]
MESPYQWFAMRATYKRELLARDYLVERGIDVFVPLRKVVKKVRGIKRKLTVPAINSLIFVHARKEELQEAKFGVDYLQYLTRKLDGRSIPIIVPDRQMEQFRQVVEDDTIDKTFYAPGELDLAKGTKVRVHGGPMDGIEGVLLKVKGKRARQFTMEVEGTIAMSTKVENFHLVEVVELI